MPSSLTVILTGYTRKYHDQAHFAHTAGGTWRIRGDLSRELPPSIPFLAAHKLDERPLRTGICERRVSLVLPVQPPGRPLGAHELGTRRKPRFGALARAAGRYPRR